MYKIDCPADYSNSLLRQVFVHLVMGNGITHPSSPREIRPQDIENAIRTHHIFANAQSTAPWQHVVWTNNLELIPNSVKLLCDAGIEVRSIYEHQDSLPLFSLVESLIEEQAWGLASDTLRYCLIQKFGGVYADINYIFNRDTTLENHKYNYFTISFIDFYIDNFFFGASPNHPVINKLLALVERNLTNPPQYLQGIDRSSSQFTDMATANPSYIAYYTECNKDGNIDVVYPSIYEIMAHKKSLRELDFPQSNNPLEPEFNTRTDHDIPISAYDELYSNIMREFFADCPSPLPEESPLSKIELCPTEDEYIGHDSSDGGTWRSEHADGTTHIQNS